MLANRDKCTLREFTADNTAVVCTSDAPSDSTEDSDQEIADDREVTSATANEQNSEGGMNRTFELILAQIEHNSQIFDNIENLFKRDADDQRKSSGPTGTPN